MIRILQCVNDMHRAGLETMLMNYYRHVNREQIQFDFLTHRPYKSDYDDEIESLGGHVYYAPRLYPQNLHKYYGWMHKFFSEHPEYNIVHSHIDSMSYLPLKAAKNANIPIRIAHSHNTSIDLDIKYPLKQYYRLRLPGVATHYFSCGKEAGEFLFPNKDVIIIPNAIEPYSFLFNEKVRDNYRSLLNLNNNLIIGNVGRLSYQKNHKFLIEIFNEVLKVQKNSILLLIGVGEKEERIRNQVKKLGLENNVRFLGNRDDVSSIYQAIDVFVMPSFFEGVPVTGIEAQFSGLNCVFSNKVPKEVDFTGNCKFISLDESPIFWAREILNSINEKRNLGFKNLDQSRYNVEFAVNILINEYYKLLKTLEK